MAMPFTLVHGHAIPVQMLCSQEAEAPMDPILFLAALASMLLVGYLAHERGRSQSRWVWTAAIIGPLAIPLLYLADAAAAVRKLIGGVKAG
jgi:hypothetical protein